MTLPSTSILLRSSGGFLALLIVCMPLTIWRSSLETNLGMDETYSLMLTTHPVDRIVELTSVDAHPPGYYLLLKGWLVAGRHLGLEPGLLWARLLNVTVLGVGLGCAWVLARRLFGPTTGTLFTWFVAVGPHAASFARDLRGYAIASLALLVATLALLFVSRSRELRGWLLYVVAASVALWTHLLSAPALAVILGIWTILRLREGAATRKILHGVVANVVVLGSFVPWLLRVGGHLEFLEHIGVGSGWMTPATLSNLLRVFNFWYPLGRIAAPGGAGGSVIPLLGWLAFICFLAMLLLLAVVRAPTRHEPRVNALAEVAILGISSALLATVLMWGLAYHQVAPAFHGPRYPGLVANLWFAGVGATGLLLARRMARGWRTALFLLAPWILAATAGQAIAVAQESDAGLARWLPTVADYLPPAGEPIYVMPAAMIPYYRQTLAAYDVRPIERLPCEWRGRPPATVLHLNYWRNLDPVRAHLARYLIDTGALAGSVRRRNSPGNWPMYEVAQLANPHRARLTEFCTRGLTSAALGRYPDALSRALPEDQVAGGPWSFLEVREGLETLRWGSASIVPVRFDHGLDAGRYDLKISGWRALSPERVVGMRFRLPGSELATEREVPAGHFEVTLPLVLSRSVRHPTLYVEHPTWSPTGSKTQAARTLSFAFLGAWVLPADDGY